MPPLPKWVSSSPSCVRTTVSDTWLGGRRAQASAPEPEPPSGASMFAAMVAEPLSPAIAPVTGAMHSPVALQLMASVEVGDQVMVSAVAREAVAEAQRRA